MEKYLKLLAVLLTLMIVISIYPAIAWQLFSRPFFWLVYIICIGTDLWCIKRLKKIQNIQK